MYMPQNYQDHRQQRKGKKLLLRKGYRKTDIAAHICNPKT